MKRLLVGAALIAWLLVPVGCAPERAEPDATGTPAAESWSTFEVPAAPVATTDLLALGASVYADHCASCHGAAGHADGPCASLLSPPARDLTAGVFRFKTTPGGDMPIDDDMFRTVSMGLSGTSMPPWRRVLSVDERWAVTHFVKTLTPAFDDWGSGEPIDLGPEPSAPLAESVRRGERLYVDAQCPLCHGVNGAGDGPNAATLMDAFGNAILPRDFRDTNQFKRGVSRRDNALMIAIGNNGNSMPGFTEAFSPDQIWDLAAYVQTLAVAGSEHPPEYGPEGRPESRHEPGRDTAADDEGLVRLTITASGDALTPEMIRVRQNDRVRIDLVAADNGNGIGYTLEIEAYGGTTKPALVERPQSATFTADEAGTFELRSPVLCGPGRPEIRGRMIVEPFVGPGVTERSGNQSDQSDQPHVVFVTGDDEYSSELTMPILAAALEASYSMRTTVLSAFPDEHADNIPGLELLEQADLMVLFMRNRTLPRDQAERIVGYLDHGNPLVSLRTSTHAFLYPEGHELESFNDFGPRYVGAPYVWDYGHENGTDVRPLGAAADHPILTGVPPEFHVPSWLYTLLPDYPVAGSQILMTGFPLGDTFDPEAGDPVDTPVAWTRRTDAGGRVFTTTLGHPVDLQQEGLQRLIINGIHWALSLEVPNEWAGPLAMNVPYKEEE